MNSEAPHRLRMMAFLLMALAFVGASLNSRSAGATADPVSIGSATRPVGLTGTVKLQAHDISFPKLGAWQINLTYAPAVLDATSCYDLAGVASCNANFATDTVRLVGTASAGLSGGTIDLATLDFKCLAAGASSLTLTVQLFADTNGASLPHSIQNGTITCSLSVGGLARLPGVSSHAFRGRASSDQSGELVAVFGTGIAFLMVAVLAWLAPRRLRAR
jgi:hypothetical protein